MLKYIVIGSIVAVVWLFSLLLSLPLWPALVLTLLVLIGIGATIGLRRFREHRANRLLERALSGHAEHASANVRPDQLPELEEVRGEFERAIALLKKSKVNEGQGGLYSLPWYAIIGPPGAGKSTALRNSGLEFPYLSERSGGAVQGLGGTRNCDWWFTNEAVVLDTAGRWSTHDEDRNEWFGFLKLLKKYRRKHPLNGLIVAVSITDLASFTDDAIVEMARKMRARVDETREQLGLSLPVYVLLTKCDLIEGFVETHGGLSKSERGQPWGFTLPLGVNQEIESSTREGLLELAHVLDVGALARAKEAKRIRDRERIFAFPRQIEDLEPSITSFMVELFKEDAYRASPHLRGVYLTSGTQEGRPINRMLSKMSSAFGLPAMGSGDEVAKDSKSYFLLEPFRNVMFADAELATQSPEAASRMWWIRVAIASSLGLSAFFLLVFPTYSWLLNRGLVETLDAQLNHAGEYLRTRENHKLLPTKLLDGFAVTGDTLRTYERDGAPSGYRAGMYVGSDLLEPLADAHARLFRGGVLTKLNAELLSELKALVRRYADNEVTPPAEEHQTYARLLRAYLLLTSPREAEQPALDDELRDDVAKLLLDRWRSHGELSSSDLSSATMHLISYLDRLKSDEQLALPRDHATVKAVRAVLSRVSSADLALETLMAKFDAPEYELDLRRMLGHSVKSISARSKVRGAFTKKAWDESLAQRFMSGTAESVPNAWVFGAGKGGPSTETLEKHATEMKARYFAKYVEAWQEFIRGLRVTSPRDQRDALSQLQELTRGTPPPIEKLFAVIGENTRLDAPAPKKSDASDGERGVVDSIRSAIAGDDTRREIVGAVAKQGAEPESALVEVREIAAPFAEFVGFGHSPDGKSADGTKLHEYSGHLLAIRDALQRELESPNDASTLKMRIQDARTAVQGMIAEQDTAWRPILENVLWPSIEGASMSFGQSQAKKVARAWCDEVVSAYDRSIRGHYPFEKNGRDASLEDVVAFFQSGQGAVWRFYDSHLSDTISRQGERFTYNTSMGQGAGRVYTSKLPEFLMRARDVGTVLGGATPKVDFEVRLRPNTRVAVQTLQVGGETIEYHNGPEKWQRLSWPGRSPSQGATLEVRGSGGIRAKIDLEGEWGLFRLLERGKIRRERGESFTVVWNLQGYDLEIAMEVRPVRGDSPFFGVSGRDRSPAFLAPFRAGDAALPRDLIPGSRDCSRGH